MGGWWGKDGWMGTKRESEGEGEGRKGETTEEKGRVALRRIKTKRKKGKERVIGRLGGGVKERERWVEG